MRKRIVAGNWKMNTNIDEAVELAKAVDQLVKEKADQEIGVAIAPPFTHLSEVAKQIDMERICLAAQNCSSEAKGAYTGEVAPSMLKSLGLMAVIIGHSERRSYFNESHDLLAKKVKLALENDLKVIFCFGEVLEERNKEIHFDVVKKQLSDSVFDLDASDFKNIILAYEPVWAIGTGVTASPEQAQEMHAFIRKEIASNYNEEIAEETTILYGGSCKPSNAKELFSNPDVDGGLIGGASLKADDFIQIINAF